jgi:4-carboxymuconolactone decarboxylase
MSEAPQAYKQFITRFPELGDAWERIADAGKKGSLDEKTARLIKLGIALGSGREGPAHASVRKARKLGITREEMEQVVALAAGTIGLPAAVAGWCWVNDVLDKK